MQLQRLPIATYSTTHLDGEAQCEDKSETTSIGIGPSAMSGFLASTYELLPVRHRGRLEMSVRYGCPTATESQRGQHTEAHVRRRHEQ